MSDALIQALAAEIQAAHPVELVLVPESAFRLIGMLQLACRHPALTKDTRAFTEKMVQTLQAALGDTPALKTVVRAGWSDA